MDGPALDFLSADVQEWADAAWTDGVRFLLVRQEYELEYATEVVCFAELIGGGVRRDGYEGESRRAFNDFGGGREVWAAGPTLRAKRLLRVVVLDSSDVDPPGTGQWGPPPLAKVLEREADVRDRHRHAGRKRHETREEAEAYAASFPQRMVVRWDANPRWVAQTGEITQ